MNKATIVIGAGYGDEGKGLATSTYAKSHSLVVRFNGGSQAAHTVVTEDGKEHVFGHIGSGSFSGVPTLFSNKFIVNPIIFALEVQELKEKTPIPLMYADKKARVTLPFDMYINQLIERIRGNSRHGSCGLGINETWHRDYACKSVTIEDLSSAKIGKNDLIKLRDEWVPKRLKELGIVATDEHNDILYNEKLLSHFIECVEHFFEYVIPIEEETLLKNMGSVLFEGAQGLGLDEIYGEFPHVTRGRTGSKYALELIGKVINDTRVPIDVHRLFVSRAYSTRHGAGPLKNEGKYPLLDKVNDPTNTENEFQGSLRIAPLDIPNLIKNITSDITCEISPYKIKNKMLITCMDQVKQEIPVSMHDQVFNIHEEYFIGLINYYTLLRVYTNSSRVTPKEFTETNTIDFMGRLF